jgi:MFS family permease
MERIQALDDAISHNNEWRANWRVVAAAALGTGFAATQAISFGSFLKPIQAEFGWGRSDITFCLLIGSMGSIFLTPFIGFLLDRWGARRIVLFGVWFYAAGIAGLGLIPSSLGSWYAAWALLALFCMGMSPVAWTLAVAARFERHRGFALSVVLGGLNIAVALIPSLSVALIDMFGWRHAYIALAALIVSLVFPVAWFWFKDDRVVVAPLADEAPTQPHRPVPGLSLQEALHTTVFWRMVGALMLVGAAVSTMTIHLQSILADAGVTAVNAAWIAGVMGPVSLVSRLGTGYLLDRFPAPLVAGTAFAIPIISCLLLRGYDGGLMIGITVAALNGIASGAEVDLIAYLASRYFGMRHFGTIYGLTFSCFTIGWSTMPIIAGKVFDITGTYDEVLLVMAGLLAFSAVLAATLGAYPKFASEADDDLPKMGTRRQMV